MSFQKRALSLVWTLGITACVGVDGGEATDGGDGDLSGMGAGDSLGATGGSAVIVTSGGTGGDLPGAVTGGASSGGALFGGGGTVTGGAAAAGGASAETGGASSGGASSGGAASGGAPSGGAASGGAASGGSGGDDECDYPTWAYGTDYYVGDIVWFEGSLYIVENDNPGYDPTISTWFWDPYSGDCDGGSGGSSSGGSGSGGSGTGGTSGDPCSAGNLQWKTGKKTNYTSYPEPGSEECIVYNGCEWAGQFAACSGVKSEAWVEAHNIVALFPGFDDYALHDICIRSGEKTMVVTVYDTCGDSDCSGCCTANKGSADALIDLESFTNARWGLPDGSLEWADLGPTTSGGCD